MSRVFPFRDEVVFDPLSLEYLRPLGGLWLIVSCTAVVIFLIGMLFFLANKCCVHCIDQARQAVYTRRQQKLYSKALFVTSGLLLGCVLSSVSTNHIIDRDLHLAFKEIHNAEKLYATRINDFTSTLQLSNFTHVFQAEVVYQFHNLTELVDFQSGSLPGNIIRSSLIYVAFALTLLTAAVAVSAAVSMKGSHGATMVGLAFTTSVVMTLSLAFHLPASFVADDMCEYAREELYVVDQTLPQYLYNCTNDPRTSDAYKMIYSPTVALMEELGMNNSIPHRSPLLSPQQLEKIFEASLPEGELSARWRTLSYRLVLLQQTFHIMSCDAINEMFHNLLGELCPSVVYALTVLSGMSILISLITLCGALLGYHASKRFSRGVYQELEDFDEFVEPGQGGGVSLSIVDYNMWSVYDNVLFWRRLSLSFLLCQVLLGILHLSIIPFEDLLVSESYTDVIIISVFSLLPLLGIWAAWKQSRAGLILFLASEVVNLGALIFSLISAGYTLSACGNNEQPDQSTCDSLYHRADQIDNIIIFCIDVILSLTSSTIAARMLFYLSKRQRIEYEEGERDVYAPPVPYHLQ